VIDRRWEAFAAREPYFAVLTAPKYLRANLTAESEREFFAGGEEYVGWMPDLIEHRLVPEFAPMSTLEFGCGVGRLAIPFARRPGRVTAVDRSPTMLATARREAQRQGKSSIASHRRSADLRSSDRSRPGLQWTSRPGNSLTVAWNSGTVHAAFSVLSQEECQ